MREACEDFYFDYKTDRFLKSKQVYLRCGCGDGCKFSSTPGLYGKEVSFISSEELRKQLVQLWEQDVRHLNFYDDTFLINEELPGQVLEELAEVGKRFAFSIGSPANTLLTKGECLHSLQKLGLRRVTLGVVNSNSDVLTRYSCKATSHDQAMAIELVRGVGLQVHLQYILFDPLTTVLHLENDLNFLETHRLIGLAPFTDILTSYLDLEAPTPIGCEYRQHYYEPADSPYLPYQLKEKAAENILYWLLYFEWEFGIRWNYFHQLLLELRVELSKMNPGWATSDMGQELVYLTLALRTMPYDLFKALISCAKSNALSNISEAELRRQCEMTFAELEEKYWRFRKGSNL